MPRIREEEPSSSDAWPEPKSSLNYLHQYLGQGSKVRESLPEKRLLSVDEAEDFHDPFSELNLFLSRKIKEAMTFEEKKWSGHLEKELLEKIAPEFKEKYPQYRLGVAALKKTWEKMSFYLSQIDEKVLNREGKIDPLLMIRENLRQNTLLSQCSHLHPYACAHQLAVKIGECIALLDGIHPRLDDLSKTIWSLIKNIIPLSSLGSSKTSYEDYDRLDQIIVKTILEISAKNAYLSQEELLQQTHETLNIAETIDHFDELHTLIHLLLAPVISNQTKELFQLTANQIRQFEEFLHFQIELLISFGGPFAFKESGDIVKRVTRLCILAFQLPDEWDDASTHLYPFLQAENLLLKERTDLSMRDCFEMAKNLAFAEKLGEQNIEILVWKALMKDEKIAHLPSSLIEKVKEEIDITLVEHPVQSFQMAFQTVFRTFRRMKEYTLHSSSFLLNSAELTKRIQHWTMQGDMIFRWVRFDPELPLLKLLLEKWKPLNAIQHRKFIDQIVSSYIHLYPILEGKEEKVRKQALLLYKHLWYTAFSLPAESSFDRYLKWHYWDISSHSTFSLDEILPLLKTQTLDQLPLIPIDEERLTAAFFEE